VARIFHCHVTEDKAQVREVYQQLKALGFAPWMDKVDILPGQDWEYEIKRALKASDFILIFFSRTSVTRRGYVQREMQWTLDAWQELPQSAIHSIPVRLDDCEVPESFRNYHYANLFDPNGLDRIVRAIRAWIAKRPETAPLPIQQSPPRTSLSEESATQDTALEPSFTNSIGMEFVLIPAGTFMMGSPESDTEARNDEKPAHRITISQPFSLGKYPVTQAQWEAVMGTNPSEFQGNPNRPVETVSWDDVQVFLRKLTEREGGGDYRLPTEAQWEYACRAGTETPRYHPDVHAIAWYEGNGNGYPQPVGQKLPNVWGLYDTLGNVFEWCHDGWRRYTAAAAVDPMGSTDAGAPRVIRGGSWNSPARYMRAAFRYGSVLGYRGDSLGFRCASSGRGR
jgi:formylglycine-generating enzyme required for sulfatase activity